MLPARKNKTVTFQLEVSDSAKQSFLPCSGMTHWSRVMAFIYIRHKKSLVGFSLRDN